MKRLISLVIPIFLLGCSEDAQVAAKPAPAALTEEALGHYCQMNLVNHDGPKAQIHLAGFDAPIWFAQVRDAIAYIRSGERVSEIVVVYVNDMGAATSWSNPGKDNWIEATSATYVLGSSARGGMGASETVPFAGRDAALAFASEHGGEIAAFGDIPSDAVLAPVPDQPMQQEPTS